MPRPPLPTLVIPVLLFLATAAPAQMAPDDEVPVGTATHWILGRRLLREGDVDAALRHLHLAYRAEPDEPLIALDFQQALAAEGYLADAVSVLDDLIVAHPDSTQWRLRRASLLLRAGKPNDALADLRELRRRGEVDLEVLGTEAAIQLQQGRVGAALDVYRDGLTILPERRADIYLGMVDVLQRAGETARIPELLDEALAAEPEDPGLRLAQVRALAVLQRHDEALAAAREADRDVLPLRPQTAPGGEGLGEPPPSLPPGHPPMAPRSSERWPEESFQIDLADTYARTGDVDRAIAVLEQVRREEPLGEEASLWLARMLIGTGRLEEAAARLDTLNGRWPDSGRGWFLRGRLLEEEGAWDDAIAEHRRARRLDPDDPEINVALVRSMLVAWEQPLARGGAADVDSLREELHEAAMRASTRVGSRDTHGQLVLGYAFRRSDDLERAAWRFGMAAEDPDLRLGALIQQSVCYDDAGETARARRVLERLHREFPDDAEVANSFGYFLAEKNQDLELAEKLVRKALEADPDNGAYLDSLGWVLYRRGHYDDAFDQLVRAVNVMPDDPVILEHLGATLLALGRPDEARGILERARAAGGDAARLDSLLEQAGRGP